MFFHFCCSLTWFVFLPVAWGTIPGQIREAKLEAENQDPNNVKTIGTIAKFIAYPWYIFGLVVFVFVWFREYRKKHKIEVTQVYAMKGEAVDAQKFASFESFMIEKYHSKLSQFFAKKTFSSVWSYTSECESAEVIYRCSNQDFADLIKKLMQQSSKNFQKIDLKVVEALIRDTVIRVSKNLQQGNMLIACDSRSELNNGRTRCGIRELPNNSPEQVSRLMNCDIVPGGHCMTFLRSKEFSKLFTQYKDFAAQLRQENKDFQGLQEPDTEETKAKSRLAAMQSYIDVNLDKHGDLQERCKIHSRCIVDGVLKQFDMERLWPLLDMEDMREKTNIFSKTFTKTVGMDDFKDDPIGKLLLGEKAKMEFYMEKIRVCPQDIQEDILVEFTKKVKACKIYEANGDSKDPAKIAAEEAEARADAFCEMFIRDCAATIPAYGVLVRLNTDIKQGEKDKLFRESEIDNMFTAKNQETKIFFQKSRKFLTISKNTEEVENDVLENLEYVRNHVFNCFLSMASDKLLYQNTDTLELPQHLTDEERENTILLIGQKATKLAKLALRPPPRGAWAP